MLNLEDQIRSTQAIQLERKLAGMPAKVIAFVIEAEVVEVVVMEAATGTLLSTADGFKELPSTPPDFQVAVIKDTIEVETLQCTEKMWAILCSDPIVLDSSVVAFPNNLEIGWGYVNGEFKEKALNV